MEGGEIHIINAGRRGEDRGKLGHGLAESCTDNFEDVGGDCAVHDSKVDELVVGV